MDEIDILEEEFRTLKSSTKVHIRIQQRSGRKYITIIEGLCEKYINKKFLSFCQKELSCNATIIKDKNIIQLTGDQRIALGTLIVDSGIVNKNDIIIHGA